MRGLPRRRAEGGVGLAADGAQGPVDALLHEIAVIGRRGLYQRQTFQERLIGPRSDMPRHAGQEGEGRALAELLVQPGPLSDHVEGVGRTVPQLEANGVADGPVVKVGPPAVHLFRRDQGDVIDHAGDHPGLIDAGVPQGLRKVVPLAQGPGDLLDRGHRHAQHAVGGHDTELPAHLVADPLASQRLQLDQHGGDLVRGDHGRNLLRRPPWGAHPSPISAIRLSRRP